jgi:hypothetical protein
MSAAPELATAALARRRRTGPLALVGMVLAAAYLRWAPLAPDLAAQVARANVIRAQGLSSWWTGWFGGILLPDYSILVPSSMAVLGVRATAVLAVLGTIAAARVLVRDTARPRAAMLACGLASIADVVNGRVTFAAGVAVAMLALVAIRGRHPVVAVLLTVASYAASPLAGFFLGIVMVAIALTDRSRRATAIAGAAGLVALAGAMALLFPGTGRMPFPPLTAIPAVLCCLGVLLFCRNRVVRVVALLTIAATGVLLLYPAAIGENITRLAWIGAVPVTVATASLRARRLVPLLALLALWPAVDLTGQLHSADSPSARAVFYQPLIQRMDRARATAAPADTGQRLEVLDTKNHWSSVYLAPLSLARGWDRQADRADNPLFYQPGALSATSYHSWLRQLAVGWVAVPRAPLDYASKQESVIIASMPGYLEPVWSSPDWTLYRVTDAAPLVTGGMVTAVHDTEIDFAAYSPGTVRLSLRWSPYLTLLSGATGLPVDACIWNAGGFTQLTIAHAGGYRLASHFDPSLSLRSGDADCHPAGHPGG